RVHARERQPAHDRAKQDGTGAAESASPGHSKSGDRMIGSSGDLHSAAAPSWIVLKVKISNSRLPVGVTTVAVSPIFLFSRGRPIGEVVEILPAATSDSSLVTRLYSTSSSLVLS